MGRKQEGTKEMSMKRKGGDWRNGPCAVKLPRSEFLCHWCDENEVIWRWIDPWVTAEFLFSLRRNAGDARKNRACQHGRGSNSQGILFCREGQELLEQEARPRQTSGS